MQQFSKQNRITIASKKIARVAAAERVATHAIFAARWRRDNFQKSHRHRRQKIARVAVA